ncbi:MAG: hypothetical protein QXY26_08480 [Ignisphaera sp.]
MKKIKAIKTIAIEIIGEREVDVHVRGDTEDVEVTRICINDNCTDVCAHGKNIDIVVGEAKQTKSVELGIRIFL